MMLLFCSWIRGTQNRLEWRFGRQGIEINNRRPTASIVERRLAASPTTAQYVALCREDDWSLSAHPCGCLLPKGGLVRREFAATQQRRASNVATRILTPFSEHVCVSIRVATLSIRLCTVVSIVISAHGRGWRRQTEKERDKMIEGRCTCMHGQRGEHVLAIVHTKVLDRVKSND